MTVRRGWAVASGGVALVAAAGAVAGSSAAEPSAEPKRPRGVAAGCSMSSSASFPGAFASRRNLVVGPLALVGAGGVPTFSSAFGGQKFPLLVRTGHVVTLELPTHARRGAGLAYGPLPQGEVSIREAHRVVTFIACDVQRFTFWSGGVLARSPRCVPLRVWIDDEPRPRRAVIHLGVRECG